MSSHVGLPAAALVVVASATRTVVVSVAMIFFIGFLRVVCRVDAYECAPEVIEPDARVRARLTNSGRPEARWRDTVEGEGEVDATRVVDSPAGASVAGRQG
jgi:hypothetical protein